MDRNKRTAVVVGIAVLLAATASLGMYRIVSRVPPRAAELKTIDVVVAQRRLAPGLHRLAHRAEVLDRHREVLGVEGGAGVVIVPSAQPCTSVNPKPSLGAPLPISLRCMLANGILISCQPLKLSGRSIDQRSASSLVEPGLRLSSTSTNMVVPLLLPYSQKEIPS